MVVTFMLSQTTLWFVRPSYICHPKVLFLLTVLTVSCEPYSKKPKATPSRNQRIIKVQGPPHFNHFRGHQKPVRKRPFGMHHGDEFIRPNHPPPIPPFFNGPSTNKIKHLPRPPPHVFHKSPTYGFGFPYKSYRPIVPKEKFRTQTLSPISVHPASSSSSSTKYHAPIFTSTSSFISSPMPHIISSDDNNGPIREIPAPNLAPKAHEGSFGSINVVSDLSDLGGVSEIGSVGGVEGVNGIGNIGVSGIGGVKIHGISDVSAVGGVLHGVGGISDGGVHGISDINGVGNIHETSGGEGVHLVGDGRGPGDIGNIASVGGVTHLEPEALLHTVAKNSNGVNLDAIVKDQGLEVNTYIKESGGGMHGKGPTVEIANFDEGSSIDVTNLIKDAAGTSDHHSTYEVTEHHNHLPSNDQIIKGHDGTKLYYAPDPDPSLPVHKVPPTNDPHSTPSNGQNSNSVYIPQISHGFPYLQGGPVRAPLSSQELFHLMHGYPTVISQPVVAFVSQPYAPGAILSGGGANYIQQGSGSYESGHYTQDGHGGNDISQYLQQPEIHNLLHNPSESHHGQEQIGGSHSSVISQSLYAPQNQYQAYQSQYQTSIKNTGSGLETSKTENLASSDINHNYQYEPEASETDSRNSLTVIRQTDEGSLNSEMVKELLLEDSAVSELNYRGKESSSENIPTILQLKNIPEVPFYASLPSQKAAEALASLQAAGSVASNYMNKIKITRGDQGTEEETRERKGKSKNSRLSKDVFEGETVQVGNEKTVVEIQQSVPLYETSISSKNLIENEDDEEILENDSEDHKDQHESEFNSLNLKEDEANEAFGKRIRPK